MPFEYRPPTGSRTSFPNSPATTSHTNGDDFFRELAQRKAARMRAARNAYDDASDSLPKARIPMPQTPPHYTPPDTVSWRLGIEEERQARRQAALEREQGERAARLRGETPLDAPVYGPQTRLEAARTRGLERSQTRLSPEESRAQHEENLRAIERRQILQDLDALQHRMERPAQAREALIDDVYNFDEPVTRPLEPTPEAVRRNRLAWSRQKMEARRAQANDPELTFGDVVELDSDLLEKEPRLAPLRAHQAAAQESANALKKPISQLSAATQAISDTFKNRFGVPIESLENGSGSLAQEVKIGLFNLGARLGKLFGQQSESPQSLLKQYKEQDALLNNALAEQRKYMDEARRLQRQIDEITDPEREQRRREQIAKDAHFGALGRGRRIAPHEGSVLDTITRPRTISQDEWLMEGDPTSSPFLDEEKVISPSRERQRAEPEDELDAAIREFKQRAPSSEPSPESVEERAILNELQGTRLELANLFLNADPNSPAWNQRVTDMKRTMREFARTLHPDKNPSVTPEITHLANKITTTFKNLEKLAAGTADAETAVLDIVRTLNAYDQEADRYNQALNPNARKGINQLKEHFVNAALQEYQASGTSIPLPIQKHGQTLRGTITRIYPQTVAVAWRDPDTGKTERLEVDKTALLAAPFQR